MKKYIKFFEGLTVTLISLIFFLTPLFFIGLTSRGLGFEKIILFETLLSLSLISFFVKSLLEKKLILKKTFLDWFWLILFIVYFLSTFLSVGIKDSLIGSSGNISQGFLFLLSMIIFYYLLVNSINLKRFKIWFVSFLSSVLLVVFYSFIQILNILFFSFSFLGNIPFNPIGSTLNLVIFLTTFPPIFIISALKVEKIFQNQKEKKQFLIKILLILGIIFNLTLLFFLKIYISLGAWLVTFFITLVILIILSRREKELKFKNLAIPLISLVAIVIFILLPSFEIFNPRLPIESSLSPNISWNISRMSLKENLLLGTGPSTFYYTFSRFRGIEFNNFNSGNIWMERGTGLIFNWLSDIGTLGVLSFLAVIILIFYNLFNLIRKNIKKDNMSEILALLLPFLSIFLLGIFLPVSNSIYFIFFLLMILVASSSIPFLSAKELKEKSITINSIPVIVFISIIFLFISLIFFIGSIRMFEADVYAQKSISSKNLDGEIKNMEKAIDCFFYEDKYYYNLADYYSFELVKNASENKSDLVLKNLNKAINLSNRALFLSPNRVSNVKQIASLYENTYLYSGKFSNYIESYYEKYRFLEPNNFQPYLKLALVNLVKADLIDNEIEKNKYIDKAINNYDIVKTKKSNWSLPYYGKAMALEKKGNLFKAIEELNKASDMDKNNIDYLLELGRLYFKKGILENKNDKENNKLDLKLENKENKEDKKEEEISDDLKRYNLSEKMYWNDDFAKAEEFFNSSLKLNPEYQGSFYHLVLLYIKTNRIIKARENYAKLINNIDDEVVKNYIIKQFGEYFE